MILGILFCVDSQYETSLDLIVRFSKFFIHFYFLCKQFSYCWSISFIDSFTMSRWQISETVNVYKCLCHSKDYGTEFYIQCDFPSESRLEVFYFFLQNTGSGGLLLFPLAPSDLFNLLCFNYGDSLIFLCIAPPPPSLNMKHLLLNKFWLYFLWPLAFPHFIIAHSLWHILGGFLSLFSNWVHWFPPPILNFCLNSQSLLSRTCSFYWWNLFLDLS